jgi:hypothetical protein
MASGTNGEFEEVGKEMKEDIIQCDECTKYVDDVFEKKVWLCSAARRARTHKTTGPSIGQALGCLSGGAALPTYSTVQHSNTKTDTRLMIITTLG